MHMLYTSCALTHGEPLHMGQQISCRALMNDAAVQACLLMKSRQRRTHCPAAVQCTGRGGNSAMFGGRLGTYFQMVLCFFVHH